MLNIKMNIVMKKLKLIRANKTKFGGAEVYLFRLCEELKKLNISYELVHSNIPKFLPSWLRVILFNIQVCKNKTSNDIYFSLERISCPDIYRAGDGVHKVFLQIENKSKFNPLHSVYLYLEKRCFFNSKKIIANSNMVKNEIISTYNIDENKIKVIHNGFPLEDFDKVVSFEKLKKEFPIKENEKIILYVGSGFKRKGVKEFLEILSKLENENFKAFIIGKEKNLSFYKKYAVDLNIENKVIFTGARSDVKDFYAIGDIFLFPTRYEPFSNVILEAMNYENVVITTKQNGASEILPAEYIMNSSIDYTIVNKIDNLFSNETEMKKVKEENLKIVQNFSIERNVKETLDIINEIVY